MKLRRPVLGALLCGWLPLLAQPAASPFQKLDFLIGNWKGAAAAAETPRGAGQGDFSFEAQLNRKIIVRRSFAEYDSGPRHEDLMVVYLDGPENSARAIYFDSEGHVIRYRVTVPAPDRAIFESEAGDPGPRYRLTYWLQKSILNGKFEVAPAGGEYKQYLAWTSRKS